MADAIDNELDLQELIDAQYGLIQTEQELYAALQAQKIALIASSSSVNQGDPSSISRGGLDGSESYAYQTVSQQLTDSAARLKELKEDLEKLFEMQNNRFPWISKPGCFRRTQVEI